MATYDRAKQEGQTDNINVVPITFDHNHVKVGTQMSYKGGRAQNKNVIMPDYQSILSGVNRSCNTVTLAPAAPTNSLTGSNNIYQYLLQPSAVTEKVKGLRFTMFINNSSSSQPVTMCPPNMSLQRLEVYNGNNELATTYYGETIMTDLNFYLNNFEFTMWSPLFGITTSWAPGSNLTIPPLGYVTFSIPLYGFWNIVKPYMQQITDNILFKFYWRNSVVNGSGTLNLYNMTMCFDVDQVASYNRGPLDNLYNNNILKYSFLDRVNISQSLVLNPSQSTKMTLQNLLGRVAFFVFMIRPSVSPTAQGYNTYLPIGQLTSATLANVQVQNPQSYDVLNYGNGLSLVDLVSINSMYLENTLFANQNVYFIPFCKSLKSALNGIQDSWYYFDGSNYILQITPDSTFPSNTTAQIDVFAYYFRYAMVDGGSFCVKNV